MPSTQDTTTTRPSTLKIAAAGILAAFLTAALFLSPIGLASAQDTLEEDTTAPAATPDDETDEADEDDEADDGTDRPDRDELTDEEREARQAEREAQRAESLQMFADELGVTVDDVQAARLAVLDARLEDKIADGDITQEQADEIRERAEESDGFGFFGGGGRGHRGR